MPRWSIETDKNLRRELVNRRVNSIKLYRIHNVQHKEKDKIQLDTWKAAKLLDKNFSAVAQCPIPHWNCGPTHPHKAEPGLLPRCNKAPWTPPPILYYAGVREDQVGARMLILPLWCHWIEWKWKIQLTKLVGHSSLNVERKICRIKCYTAMRNSLRSII